MTRRILAMTLLLLAVMYAPAAASSRQLTLMQDDAVFLGSSPHDPEQAMADAMALGVDVVRVFVGWSKVSPGSTSRVKPAGFDVSNPDLLPLPNRAATAQLVPTACKLTPLGFT